MSDPVAGDVLKKPLDVGYGLSMKPDGQLYATVKKKGSNESLAADIANLISAVPRDQLERVREIVTFFICQDCWRNLDRAGFTQKGNCSGNCEEYGRDFHGD